MENHHNSQILPQNNVESLQKQNNKTPQNKSKIRNNSKQHILNNVHSAAQMAPVLLSKVVSE